LKSLRFVFLAALAVLLLLGTAGPRSAPPDPLTALQRSFENPPDDSRIMMRWWWFGPSATKPELEREMRFMKEGGIGGFEVQPVYPLTLDDPAHGFKNYPYMSDEFIEALRFTSEKAKEMGLRMDLTLGSGWPFGGAYVPVTQAAGKLRMDVVAVPEKSRRVATPIISAGEKLLAVFEAPGEVKNFDAAKAREITSFSGDALELPEQPSGPQVILFFIASRTGMQVKRPAIGAEGFVLDHYDRAATENHLKTVGDRLAQSFGANPPYAIFCDSLEVYASDWTGDFLEEFQKRRGYDLKPYLTALVGDIGEKTGAIRHDWGQTLSELFEERFLMPIEAWAKERHTFFRAQLYGIPPARLSSYRFIDLGEGEGAHWKQFAPTRWASSANHLYGRAVTSTETWTWLHSPAFRATPLDMKAEADVQFLEGSNQFIGHGWPYSPESAGKPGQAFYAAAVFDQNNPWWPVMPDVTKYFQRMSFLLRQGRPVNDVAIYVPTDDAYAQFSPGKVSIDGLMNSLLGPNLIPQILEAGYNFDFIDDAAIQELGKTESGNLAVNENRYKIVILPGVERIPVATLRKLSEFARQGGVLIALRRKPSLAPGFAGSEEQTKEIREIVGRLFEGTSAPAHLVADDKDLLGPLIKTWANPDLSLVDSASDVGFVHRSVGDAEIYFVANTGNKWINAQVSFRADAANSGITAEWWDPFTGAAYPAKSNSYSASTEYFSFDLQPYESRVIVFSHRKVAAAGAQPARELPAPRDLSDGWKASFGDASKPVPMDHLRSWTDDEATRFFSGQAVYEKTVTIPGGSLDPSLEYKLDFGDGSAVTPGRSGGNGMRAWYEGPIREAAVVYVNEKRAGSVWHPPYSVDVTKLLHAGQNAIRVVVGNTAINELAGQSLPDYKLLNLRFGERFTPQDMKDLQPLPSGLLGKIQLIGVRARQPLPAN
jgi:hypothetical protein